MKANLPSMIKISRIIIVLGILLVIPGLHSFSQVGISTDNSSPDNSAMLDVKSINKGLLVPRMTKSGRDAISSPATGLVIFNTTSRSINVFNGTYWSNLDGSPSDLWKCGQPITDIRDNKNYNTVLLGTQCWMAQNLNTGTIIYSTENQTANSLIEKYCFNDLESNCNVYGGLYQWDEAMQYSTVEGVQGICPAGWHLPTDAEFTTIADFLGGEDAAGGKMKETGFSHWIPPNQGATNETGFTGIGSGRRSIIGTSEFLTWYLYMWSSTAFDSSIAWERSLNSYYTGLARAADYVKTYGFSVRCLKN
jgi:uncharacterized protein (TIGR02145 family)